MGDAKSMNILETILILVAAFLAVFWQAAFQGIPHLLGVQVDLLPSLMVYAALRANIVTVALLAVAGGLWLDSLSANPLAITIIPLFFAGFPIHMQRGLIVQDQLFAQFVLGLIASAVVPALTLALLLTTGHKPSLGWGTIWQFTVMIVGGGLATPVWFVLLDWLQRLFGGRRLSEPSFRPDREIRRGRT
jgi:hypothetical protein